MKGLINLPHYKYKTHVEPFLDKITKWIKEGDTEIIIAKRLSVGNAAWARYKNNEKDLREAILLGDQEFGLEIRTALRKRAIGFRYSETIITEEIGPNGPKTISKIVTKEVPPDVSAIALYMKFSEMTPEHELKRAQIEKIKTEISIMKRTGQVDVEDKVEKYLDAMKQNFNQLDYNDSNVDNIKRGGGMSGVVKSNPLMNMNNINMNDIDDDEADMNDDNIYREDIDNDDINRRKMNSEHIIDVTMNDRHMNNNDMNDEHMNNNHMNDMNSNDNHSDDNHMNNNHMNNNHMNDNHIADSHMNNNHNDDNDMNDNHSDNNHMNDDDMNDNHNDNDNTIDNHMNDINTNDEAMNDNHMNDVAMNDVAINDSNMNDNNINDNHVDDDAMNDDDNNKNNKNKNNMNDKAMNDINMNNNHDDDSATTYAKNNEAIVKALLENDANLEMGDRGEALEDELSGIVHK